MQPQVSLEHGTHSVTYSHLPFPSSSEVNADDLSGSAIPRAHPGITNTQAEQMALIYLAPLPRFCRS